MNFLKLVSDRWRKIFFKVYELAIVVKKTLLPCSQGIFSSISSHKKENISNVASISCHNATASSTKYKENYSKKNQKSVIRVIYLEKTF